MSVSLNVGNRAREIGTSDFLNAFFSTVVTRLEGGHWGTRYPILMNRLYMGEVSALELHALKAELAHVREGLKCFGPEQVVWDFADPTKQPPWGSAISSDIRSLSEYFWTSDGKQLFDVLSDAIHDALSETKPLTIS
jgi:2,3-bisphosphoglycerate-dependent phosphoglycerate mutase